MQGSEGRQEAWFVRRLPLMQHTSNVTHLGLADLLTLQVTTNSAVPSLFR